MSYTDQINALGPLSWWQCDDVIGGGGVIVDTEAVTNMAFFQTGDGSIDYQQIGAINRDTDNKSINLNQGTGFAVLRTPDVEQYERDGDWTMCGWFKQAASETDTAIMLYIEEAGTTKARCYITVASLTLAVKFKSDGGSLLTATGVAGTIEDGVWSHIALVRTDTVFRLYINGLQVGTDSSNADPFTGLGTGTGTRIAFGGRATDFGFEGWVDECMYFERALDDTEMLELYRAGAELIVVLADPQMGFASDLDPYDNDSLIEEVLTQQRFEHVIKEANRIAPDVTIILGDMTHSATARQVSLFDESLAKLNGQVMVTDGNHDARLEADVDTWRTKYNALGVLPNNTANGASHFDLPSGVRIVEFSSNYYYKQFEPNDAFDAADRTANASEVDTKLSGAAGKVIMFTHVPIWEDTETTPGQVERDLKLNASGGFREDALTMIRGQSNVDHVFVGHRHNNNAITAAASDGLLITSFIGSAREFTSGTTNFDYGVIYVNGEGETVSIEVVEFNWEPFNKSRNSWGVERGPAVLLGRA